MTFWCYDISVEELNWLKENGYIFQKISFNNSKCGNSFMAK